MKAKGFYWPIDDLETFLFSLAAHCSFLASLLAKNKKSDYP
jgi:hypothetical protein